MKPEKEYLKKLLNETLDLIKGFDYCDIDTDGSRILYLATKNYNWLGFHEGIASLADLKAKHVKFSEKIRSNCVNYDKHFYKEDKLIKVEGYGGDHDKPCTWYRTCYRDNKRYIYPCGIYANGIGYTYVTEYRDGKVYEEYMVARGQILYWGYDYLKEDSVEAYYINYVPTGKYPTIAESIGTYDRQTLEYKETYGYVWYRDLDKETKK